MMTATKALAGMAVAGVLAGCGAGMGDRSDIAGSGNREPGLPVYLQMTLTDVDLANGALDSALESRVSGAAVSWHNAETGNYGSVTPLATFRATNGSYCQVPITVQTWPAARNPSTRHDGEVMSASMAGGTST